MSNTIAKVKSGDQLRIPAPAWNSLMDMLVCRFTL